MKPSQCKTFDKNCLVLSYSLSKHSIDSIPVNINIEYKL